jgi:putative sterol carrier protein
MNIKEKSASHESRFALLKDLRVKGSDKPEATFARLGELLKSSKTHGVLQLRLVDGNGQETLIRTSVGQTKGKSGAQAKAKPRIEIITTAETWTEMAAARLSPIDAFLGGKMRVRGDPALAQTLLREAAGSAGRTHLCGEGDA